MQANTNKAGLLRTYPIHIFLLPVFFILNISNQFAGLISRKETIESFIIVIIGILALFILSSFIYKDKTRAGIAALLVGGLYLFFGNMKEMLAGIPLLSMIAHYRVLLPLLAFLLIMLLYRLSRRKNFSTTNLFLNLLLLLYLGIEIFKWGFTSKADNRDSQIPHTSFSAADKPAIYLLVPDCYPSSEYQHRVLGIEKNELDSGLAQRGFQMIPKSSSNYKYPAFSMASLLNMDYLSWLEKEEYARPYHYNRATNLVETSGVIGTLKQNGYRLTNLSVFDLEGMPSIKKERFLSTTGREMIFYNTFYYCIRRDVLPIFFPSLRTALITHQQKNNRELLENFKGYNRLVIDSLLKMKPSGESPTFTYAHLEMPHFPYFFDSTGNEYPSVEIFGSEMITNRERFANYIRYTNKKLLQVVDSLKAHHNGKAIILIQSDHGLNDIAGSWKTDAFRNYSAFYFPNQDYHLLYDSMSNVNTFRVLFNTYFGQRLPLLKDTSYYIK